MSAVQLYHKPASTAAAFLLRNLACCPDAGAHFLAQPHALPCLLGALERASGNAQAACCAASCLWSLVYYSDKVRPCTMLPPDGM